ncbi:SusC/RagA family TonB-linked outer membrane protein [Bacteroidia bacterium]|nr:SusC/RagA family TonB-linked outer membrane protein [Bacteroidia bacterium]
MNRLRLLTNMGLMSFFILLFCFFSSPAQAQNVKKNNISIEVKNEPIKNAFAKITKATNYKFFYDESVVADAPKVHLNFSSANLTDILAELENQSGLKFITEEGNITVSRKNAPVFTTTQQVVQREYSGIVTDDSGDPVIGASISVKGTNAGTVTNLDGYFSINAPSGSVLAVSYVGYKPKEIALGNNTNLDIALNEDNKLLDEVIVIGYGVQKKSVVTAAISRVSSSDLETTTPTRIEDVLKGKVSGIQIIQSSGQPGADSKVRIRGIGTVNDANPLYIVDGMPVGGGINYLNPTDIESVEILKDAASAAIYGTRGANGVILVTTKSGKAGGKATISYDFSYGWQNPWKKKAVLDAKEYMTLMNEREINDNGSPRYTPEQISAAKTTDWQDEVFNYDAPVVSHQVSATGGNDKGGYFLSFGYFNHEGIIGGNVDKSNYKRYSLRSNNSYTIFEEKGRNFLNRVKVGSNIGYSRAVSSGLEANSEYGSLLGSAVGFDPTIPVYATDPEAVLAQQPLAVKDKNGRVFSLPPAGFQEIANPVAMLYQPNASHLNEDKIVSSFWGEIDILDGLKFRTSYDVDLAFWGNDGYTYPYFLASQGKNVAEGKGTVTSDMHRGFTWQVENVFSYDKTFGDHSIAVVLGQSAFKSTTRELYGSAVDPETTDPNKAQLNNTIGGETQERAWGGIGGATFHSLASYFGRASYNYAERYMIQATLRRDGSSRFGSNNKWALFPAVSVGWNVMNESFMKSLDLNWLNVLKLRGSWGRNGNENIGDLRYAAFNDSGQNYYFGGGYLLGSTDPGGTGTMVNGISPAALSNPDLRWEQSEQTDLGFDLRFLSNALSFSMDYYSKKTSNMLMDQPIPRYVGQGAPLANIGEMKNWGYEFEIGWKGRVSDFNYYVSANASRVYNELIKLGNASGENVYENAGASGVGEFIKASNGEVFPYFYGLKTNGIFQNQAEIDAYTWTNPETGAVKKIQPNAKPGDVRFFDTNDDGSISSTDKVKIGKGMPDWMFGFTLGGDYKGFDINLFFQGTHGNDMFDFAQRGDIPAMNRPEWMLQRWHGEGTSDRIPRMTSANPNGNWNSSDLYIKDGSYLRLKSAQFGYTLPVSLTRKISVQNLRIFVNAENLLTFTKYDGFDPEAATGEYTRLGVDRGIYPQSRTISLGANITF